MRDQEIDRSEIPELQAGFFDSAVAWPGPKRQITLRLDPDVLEFFKSTGRGYQSTINSVLRSYMTHRRARAHRPKATRKKAS
jgi:uncharacterized protein (DUF4415 family)